MKIIENRPLRESEKFKNFTAKRAISIFVNLRYLRLKLMIYKANNNRNSTVFLITSSLLQKYIYLRMLLQDLESSEQ